MKCWINSDMLISVSFPLVEVSPNSYFDRVWTFTVMFLWMSSTYSNQEWIFNLEQRVILGVVSMKGVALAQTCVSPKVAVQKVSRLVLKFNKKMAMTKEV